MSATWHYHCEIETTEYVKGQTDWIGHMLYSRQMSAHVALIYTKHTQTTYPDGTVRA